LHELLVVLEILGSLDVLLPILLQRLVEEVQRRETLKIESHDHHGALGDHGQHGLAVQRRSGLLLAGRNQQHHDQDQA